MIILQDKGLFLVNKYFPHPTLATASQTTHQKQWATMKIAEGGDVVTNIWSFYLSL